MARKDKVNELIDVLITGKLHPSVIQRFQTNEKLNLVYEPDCSVSTLQALIPKAKVLVSRSETAIDRDLLDLAKDLKIIARAAVGVGNIDVDYATQKGILVLNTPGKNTNSAAELTLGLLISVLRKIPPACMEVKRAGWNRHAYSGFELRGKRIGLVGLGNVGQRVAKFAHGFDMQVFGYDPYIAPQKFVRLDVSPMPSLQELAKNVDILSVHVPLNRETRGMVDASVLQILPKGSYVLNAARGGIIDEAAILACLQSGQLRGAGIDTWDGEPMVMAELAQHPCVVATPHIGASTEEAQLAIGECIYEQIIKALEGGVVDYPINLPQIGVIDNPLVKPYTILAEKLGRMAGQLHRANPTKIEVLYRGDLAGVDHALIRLGWMKGYVSCAVDSYVSYVNAQQQFENLGLSFVEAKDPDFASYRSAIKFILHFERESPLSVGGIAFDATYIRISLINGFEFEVEPTGNFILISNEDRPGVIGAVGSFLAQEQINIDSFELSRKSRGGEAMALVRVDAEVTPEVIAKMGALPHIKRAYTFNL